MTPGKFLLSPAYFPPLHYFSVIAAAEKVFIENEESYIKQTYRNRCRIYSSNGPLTLSVPVLEGSFHKIPFRDVKIDYTKRWQHIHIRAIESAYRSSPFFEFYFDKIRTVIETANEYLSELNYKSLITSLEITGIETAIEFTDSFEKPSGEPNDFRYTISPKKTDFNGIHGFQKYPQTFSEKYGFIQGLSIIDLIFNMGPDSFEIIRKSIPAGR